ncbi:DUF3298 domain-containing protein [Prevotella denticola]
MMNRKFLFLSAFLLSVVAAVGCADWKKPAVKCLADSVASKTAVPDSVVVEKEVPLVVDSIGKSFSSKKGNLDFAYDFPVSGPSPLVDSLRAYLSSEMADAGYVKPYGNLSDGKGMITYYAKTAFEGMNRLFEDDGKRAAPCVPEVSLFVRKRGETERFVTYVSTYYIYAGGAHGMTSEYGVTFDKKSGVRLRNILNADCEKVLQPLLKEKVENYLGQTVGSDDREMSEAELKDLMDGLFLEDGVIPLPGNGLYLSPEGVVFSYGQYEISAYAVGMPTFTVPYEKIGKYLSPEARRLAGIK